MSAGGVIFGDSRVGRLRIPHIWLQKKRPPLAKRFERRRKISVRNKPPSAGRSILVTGPPWVHRTGLSRQRLTDAGNRDAGPGPLIQRFGRPAARAERDAADGLDGETQTSAIFRRV